MVTHSARASGARYLRLACSMYCCSRRTGPIQSTKSVNGAKRPRFSRRSRSLDTRVREAPGTRNSRKRVVRISFSSCLGTLHTKERAAARASEKMRKAIRKNMASTFLEFLRFRKRRRGKPDPVRLQPFQEIRLHSRSGESSLNPAVPPHARALQHEDVPHLHLAVFQAGDF